MDCLYKNQECSLPSDKNDLKILVCQLKREVEKIVKEHEKDILKLNRKSCRNLCLY
jgi:hypothetical protein